MSVNRYARHVCFLCEDQAWLDVLNGFLRHPRVQHTRTDTADVARGWPRAVDAMPQWVRYLERYPEARLVVLLDLDGQGDHHRAQLRAALPERVSDRVFVVGTRQEVEVLTARIGLSREQIGMAAAEEIATGTWSRWEHAELADNPCDDLERLRPILFGT